MKRHRIILVGLACLLLAGLDTASQARGGGGGHGGGGRSFSGGGHLSYVAPPPPKTASGSHLRYGRRYGGRGGRGWGGGYYGDQDSNLQTVSSHFESSHFSGPDHISPAEYSHFVKNYSWPQSATPSTGTQTQATLQHTL